MHKKPPAATSSDAVPPSPATLDLDQWRTRQRSECNRGVSHDSAVSATEVSRGHRGARQHRTPAYRLSQKAIQGRHRRQPRKAAMEGRHINRHSSAYRLSKKTAAMPLGASVCSAMCSAYRCIYTYMHIYIFIHTCLQICSAMCSASQRSLFATASSPTWCMAASKSSLHSPTPHTHTSTCACLAVEG